MEFIVEFFGELIFEGILEVVSNKKISRWVRYPLLTLFILFFAIIIFGLIFGGIASLKNSLIGGMFIIVVGVILLIAGLSKFREFYLYERKKDLDDTNNE